MKIDINEEILKRLDAMVFLLLEIKDKDGKMSLRDKIRLLNDAGFGYVQIAKMLGTSPGSVAVQLSNLKKKDARDQAVPPSASSPANVPSSSGVTQENGSL